MIHFGRFSASQKTHILGAEEKPLFPVDRCRNEALGEALQEKQTRPARGIVPVHRNSMKMIAIFMVGATIGIQVPANEIDRLSANLSFACSRRWWNKPKWIKMQSFGGTEIVLRVSAINGWHVGESKNDRDIDPSEAWKRG